MKTRKSAPMTFIGVSPSNIARWRLRDIRARFYNAVRALARNREASMRNYKIYILNQEGRIALSYDFAGPDDLFALEESKRYSDKRAVEIWERARQVVRIDQGVEAVPQPNLLFASVDLGGSQRALHRGIEDRAPNFLIKLPRSATRRNVAALPANSDVKQS